MTSTVTPEMAAIIEADKNAVAGQVNLVAALPGSGKTSLLQKIVRESTVPTTYVMFNRKPLDEFKCFVEREKLNNVYVTTFHKFAFDAVRECGINIRMTNGDSGGQNIPPEISKMIKDEKLENVSELLKKKPEIATRWFSKSSAGDWDACSEVVLYWMASAKHLPELLATSTVDRFLSSKKLYVDEAQDCTPNMVKIIKMAAERGASVTIAGDTNQSINGFMGACDPVGNYKTDFPNARRLPLSISWRFGQAIADAFNTITRERCVGRPDGAFQGRVDIVIQSGTNKTICDHIEDLKIAGIQAVKRGKKESSPECGDVEVSTVYQAKGGGWHTCIVMDDVISRFTSKKQARRLVATAVSRARERLYVQRRLACDYNIRESERVKIFGSISELHDVLATCGDAF